LKNKKLPGLAMSEGKYDPRAFSEGMGIFKEHLKRTCPEALEILSTPTIGFHCTVGASFTVFRLSIGQALNVFPNHHWLGS